MGIPDTFAAGYVTAAVMTAVISVVFISRLIFAARDVERERERWHMKARTLTAILFDRRGGR